MKNLKETKLDIKIKLSALWGSVMSLYIYCDYFQLYVPGKLDDMIQGNTIFGSGDQMMLLGLSTFMLITSLMIAFSILLPPRINQILNISVGLVMTAFLALVASSSTYYFYIMYATVEALITAYIAFLAFKWPKNES